MTTTSTNTLTVKLSQEEILLISMRMRLPIMLGIDEKLLGLSREMLQVAMTAAEHSLLARDFLRAGEDGTPKLAPVILALVGACSRPEKTVLATRTVPGQPASTVIYHRAQEMIVNHAVETPGVHTLVALAGPEQIVDGITAHMRVGPHSKPTCPAGTVSEDLLSEVRSLVAGGKQAEVAEKLAQALPAETAELFGRTMLEFQASTTIATFRSDPDGRPIQPESFSVMEGAGMLWMFSPLQSEGEQNQFRVQPVTAEEVRQAVEALI